MNTKELIDNIRETKNTMQICANSLNSDIIQAGVLEGSVTEEPYVAVLTKLHKLTSNCILDIYNLDKLCNLLESLSEEEKEKEL